MYCLIKKKLGVQLMSRLSCLGTKLLSQTETMPKTAGIIIIGDEILKGQTQDTNSHYLCQALHSSGVHVKKISVIGDVAKTISSEVQEFSATYDFVLTSGGIGPTHDDLTIESIAKAFGEEVVPHPDLVELCQKYFGQNFQDSPKFKLACVPQSAALHYGIDKSKGERFLFPLISMKNVYIFPGIPVLLQRLMDSLQHIFKTDDVFYVEKLLVNAIETDIANILSSCVEKFKGTGISIGSYPDWFNNYYKVKLIIESSSETATKAAVTALRQTLPSGRIISGYVEDPVALKGMDVFGDIFKDKHPVLREKILVSAQILDEAMTKYAPEEMYIAFNGGKDCTALLHLYFAALCRKYKDDVPQLQALYIKSAHPFDEVRQFIGDSISRYNLGTITMEGEMKAALTKLRSQRPNIKAIVMGTRCTDPWSQNLPAFASTDSDWPSFMRVNPLLNWSYHDIWTFLRVLHIPYCVLYDRGYTSLGSRDKTHRNERLRYVDEHGNTRYGPAHSLKEENMERYGRL